MVETACDPAIERHLKGHKDAITGLHFHPNNNQLVSSSLDKSLMLWNLTDSIRGFQLKAHKDAALDVTYAPSGEIIASASRDRSIRIWIPSRITGQSIDFKAHSGAVSSLDFCPHGERLLSASYDKTCKLWMLCKRKFLLSFNGHTNWVRCAKFSPDSRLIISCSDDKTVKLWDVSTGKCVKTINEVKAPALYVEFHPSGGVIGSANIGGYIKLYDLRMGSLYQHYAIHKGPVHAAKFHPKGNFMLTASEDTTMKVLDLLEGRPIYTLKGHNGAVRSIAFSLNGDYFASGGADFQLLTWKTNFDKDDNNRKVPRIFIPPVQDIKYEDKWSSDTDTQEESRYEKTGDYAEQQEFLLSSLESVKSKSDSKICKESIPKLPNENIQVEVINLRKERQHKEREQDSSCIGQYKVPDSCSSQASNIIEMLNEQVESLRNTVNILEQRLSAVEKELKHK
ncbi:POC1 centriolar protein homolog A-like isoform X1 [Polistes fuscatus]|uniref:POC1 centriolar protein homolog A-like isoform X1 n=1 Tax=Polistes fuscatus TaxID=30207 RepID=UPI001CA921BF|nr:POC1 centriolar protein homolog A-like isoform X1 [Polistes fuscatus]XP_043489299.1 POC1 centriolar protein homolog A-like isoform X1 [Polistes fuscatus]XP_043489300.1 POC1 centriolar protein homolog A-like isoform X1 [Polistes fuscatus]